MIADRIWFPDPDSWSTVTIRVSVGIPGTHGFINCNFPLTSLTPCTRHYLSPPHYLGGVHSHTQSCCARLHLQWRLAGIVVLPSSTASSHIKAHALIT